MHTAFDITETCSPEPTGCGQFTARLVQAYAEANRARGWGDTISLWYRASHRRRAHHAVRLPGCAGPAALPRFNARRGGGADVIFGFATHAPGLGRAARIGVLFDVFSALPQSAAWQRPASRRRKLLQYARLARVCSLVIAVSETTRRDFVAHFDFPLDRVLVVGAGVGDAYRPRSEHELATVRRRYGLPERYLLYVGAPVPRKNVPRLIEAYGRSRACRDHALVVAGSTAGHTKELREVARGAGVADRLLFPGYVEDAAMPALYSAADAFLFPSFYEGFGMPILEAMACGTPVLTADRGAAPEAAGGHAVLVDPLDTNAIARGIDAAAAMPAAQRETAAAYARRHTWTRAAAALRAACRSAARPAGP